MAEPMRIVRVVAFDPGSKHTAYAVADSGRDARGLARFVSAGMTGSSREELAGVIEASGAHFVAVEMPSRVHPGKRGDMAAVLGRGKHVVETTRIAERIATIAAALGLQVVERRVDQWRRALCGKGVRGTPKDAHVARVVPMYVVNLPASTNVHERDALGLAIVGLWTPPALGVAS